MPLTGVSRAGSGGPRGQAHADEATAAVCTAHSALKCALSISAFREEARRSRSPDAVAP